MQIVEGQVVLLSLEWKVLETQNKRISVQSLIECIANFFCLVIEKKKIRTLILDKLGVELVIGQLGQGAARHSLNSLPGHEKQLHENRYAFELSNDRAVVLVACQLMQRAHRALDDLLHGHVVDYGRGQAALLRILIGVYGLDEELNEARDYAELAQRRQIVVAQRQVAYQAYGGLEQRPARLVRLEQGRDHGQAVKVTNLH